MHDSRSRSPLLGRPRFTEELSQLRFHLLEMGAATEEILRDSIIALTTQDMPLAGTIIPRDDLIDVMDQNIEAECLRLMARPSQRPADLRVIAMTMKAITDMERIGDHAVDISRVAQRMDRDLLLYKPLVDVPRLGSLARTMLHDSLEAFVHRDLGRVTKVISGDDVVDALHAQMRRDLQDTLRNDPACGLQASYLLFVVYYLERICDHCKNIVERIAYMETGKMRGTPEFALTEAEPSDDSTDESNEAP